MSVVEVSSSRIVGYAGCSRKSFLMRGSGAATPGGACTVADESDHKNSYQLASVSLCCFSAADSPSSW